MFLLSHPILIPPGGIKKHWHCVRVFTTIPRPAHSPEVEAVPVFLLSHPILIPPGGIKKHWRCVRVFTTIPRPAHSPEVEAVPVFLLCTLF